MKLEALDHPKTLDFAARLGVTLPTAIGHLELFWAFVGKKCPQGNVGKFPNGAISMSCQWSGPPDHFVDSLLQAGFVDRDGAWRLLVHDWADHQPNWVKAKLAKLKLSVFRPDSSTNESPQNGTFVPTGEATDIGVRSDCSPNEQGVMSVHNTPFVPTGEPSSRARVLPSEAKGSEGKRSVKTHTRSANGTSDPDQHASELEIQRVYPKVSRPNWATALHHARRLVELGKATWAQLAASAMRYAAYCAAPGMEWYTVMGPVNYFSAVDDPWSLPWDPPPKPKTETELRQEREKAELIALAEGRAARGLLHCRDPLTVDTPSTYGTYLREAENELRNSKATGRPSAGVSRLAAAKAMPK